MATDDYAERLRLPWWLWLCGLAVAVLLALELWMGAGGLRAWVPFVVLIPLAVLGLWRAGRIRVAVEDGELTVDDAHIPLSFVTDAVPVDAAGKRELLGVGSHELAFVVQRPWVSGAVQVVIDDPADPTPYWLVSSRDPVKLAAAITARSAVNAPHPR
ncbi:Protein of unknown function [Asanoa hainanensis]|uniref:DUF3093 domain-containing protein n=1 Tax=Asanoa hainanensis TaxID=560556 RepID=A0A239LS55_9ACTN|nr:DUF3093 domain-containing protein [Asanoa hainanensis]SNT32772.1 Protein of unknown function [Asanoa hainanensis]